MGANFISNYCYLQEHKSNQFFGRFRLMGNFQIYSSVLIHSYYPTFSHTVIVLPCFNAETFSGFSSKWVPTTEVQSRAET